MNCPKCGKEMQMFVSVRIKAPARYAHNLSKASIRKKGVRVTAVNWSDGYLACWDCKHREDI